jgi:hypothetical protein
MFEQDSFGASTVGDALAANAITETTAAADTNILNCFMFAVSNLILMTSGKRPARDTNQTGQP